MPSSAPGLQMTDGCLTEQEAPPGHHHQNTRFGDRGEAAGYCKPRGQHQQAQESGELVNCPLPAEVAASFPQGSGKMLGCSQQAEMVANFPRGLRKMLGSSQYVGILENFLQKRGLSSLPQVMMSEYFPRESSQGVASSL